MDLSELEQHVFAYYVANWAQDLRMDPRFCPYGELLPLIEDKIKVATSLFGAKPAMACPNVARALLDLLIERGGFSTFKNDFGTMYQYHTENYRKCIKDLQESNAIILKAQSVGPDFWEKTFES